MTGGFSFCGTDIASIGLEYAPELEDTYVYRASAAKLYEETFDGHDGGYFYGASREPKEFTLRCYFEEKEIDKGIMARCEAMFREGRSGKLVFSRRPWCYYYATVTEYDPTEISNYLNGVIKIKMKAYYPYARSDLMTVKRIDKDANRIMTNTAFFENAAMVPQTSFGSADAPLTAATDILLCNPGTAPAHVRIEIGGDVGDGVIITNHATGEVVRFAAMGSDVFDGENNYVILDAISGKCIAHTDGADKINFLYHGGGFLTLKPAFPVLRGLNVAAKDDTVRVVGKLYNPLYGETGEDLAGQYIWLGGKWMEISGVTDEHHLTLAESIGGSAGGTTMTTRMNKITIEPVSEMNLTRLNFVYKPTFS